MARCSFVHVLLLFLLCCAGADAQHDNCTNGTVSYIGDGYCDSENNNEECGYDGGDCCECTRVDDGSYSSSSSYGTNGFICLDQSAQCYDPAAAALYSSCTGGVLEYLGNGYCDFMNNNEECGYDGGDCCECTCVDDSSSSSYASCEYNRFFCLDPSAQCYDPAAAALNSSCTGGVLEYLGNGYCDFMNNNEECGYDGGDCCECTCVDDSSSSSYASCEYNRFFCLDPSAQCYDPAAAALNSSCTGGVLEYLWDGYCDSMNNNEECGYDGGDCCACTCIDTGDYSCGGNDFNCLDPDAAGQELHNCEESPPAAVPCPAERQGEWVVENTAHAKALAEAVYCSGGTFHVKWKGNIVVDETIYVVNGTVFNLTGVDSSAAVDGGGTTRLFTVVNASLHVSDTTISNGAAVSGGAIAAARANLTFDRTAFVGNNVTAYGGALFVLDGSTVAFGGKTGFFNNTASMNGGVGYVTDRSDVSWAGNSTFSGNNAGADGGALYVTGGSGASWAGASDFSRNTAVFGGALYVTNGSSASLAGETTFSDNNAISGGAVFVTAGGEASWPGQSSFSGNWAAVSGGALYVLDGSSAVYESEALFYTNRANMEGGAIYVANGSKLSWSAGASFFNNSANYGGAVLVTDGSTMIWNGGTNFTSNAARSNGGAVASKAFDSSSSSSSGFIDDDYSYSESNDYNNSSGSISSSYYLYFDGLNIFNDEMSFIVVDGTTHFVNNTCGANGGGVAILGMLSLSFEKTANVTFYDNAAGVAGGAVFISDTGIGPLFEGTRFVSNSAQNGGAVHATGSGRTRTGDNYRVGTKRYPTTFKGCNFVGNIAYATGGAVDSSSGLDTFVRTCFNGNSAGVGGALRLAGEASIDSCSFVENVSGVGQGPAVSNIGYISDVTGSTFHDNVFNCEPETFLNFSEPDGLFETVCDGCDTSCRGCYFEEPQLVPECLSLSEAGVKHATSPGGNTTVAALLIDPGYWRATSNSTKVLECYNSKACRGGVTGARKYCDQGYEGPYCSICSANYTASLGFTCKECSDSAGGIALAVVLAVVGVVVGVAIILYLVSGEREDAGRGIMYRMTRYIPLQSVKIIIVAWQILTQFTSLTNVTYPRVYQRFLDGIDLINFDLSWVISTGCIVDVDFHDRLLITTIGPIVAMVLLGGTYAVAVSRSRGSEPALRNVRHRHVSMVLLVMFFVYSSVSSVVFQTFDCDDLEDGKKYLRADYRIECDSTKHKALQIYAGFMIALYPVGIPAFFVGLLFRNRAVLTVKASRENDSTVQSISDLWKPYKPSRFYYEVIECGRRILLTSFVLLVDDDTAAQIAVTFTVAIVFAITSEVLAPYESLVDTWVSRAGHAVVYSSMYFALLLKVDISDEEQNSQKVFEVLLVAAHACMVLAVVVEAVVLACSLRIQQRDAPEPRLSRDENLRWNRENSLVVEEQL